MNLQSLVGTDRVIKAGKRLSAVLGIAVIEAVAVLESDFAINITGNQCGLDDLTHAAKVYIDRTEKELS
jgi:hypothetical protein